MITLIKEEGTSGFGKLLLFFWVQRRIVAEYSLKLRSRRLVDNVVVE